MERPLIELLSALADFSLLQGDPTVVVQAITSDSRQVRPGTLFVAIRGATVDGHHFIAEAVARGAVAVVGTAEPQPAWFAKRTVPYVQVPDARQALALLAAALHGFPSRRLRLVGVTGTDGKTTTVNLIYHLLGAAGHRPGMVSTVAARIGDQELDTGLHVTTPEAPEVQSYLAQMVAAGCDVAVLEATSHGLHQGRVAACDFDVAVITNVTHEHLDYHGSWEAYLDAKAILFRSLAGSARKLGQPKVAVLNADDASYEPLRAIPADQHLSYAVDTAQADLWAEQVRCEPGHLSFLVHTPLGSAQVTSPLVGRFNVYNLLAALGAGLALGLPLEVMAHGLAHAAGVPGRMERIDRGQDFLALVDFAHTPASLARALEAARLLTAGRLIAVFGSAGLRDVQKRALMAEIALQQADYTILTAEDPRTESLEDILEEMARGARRAGGREGHDFQRIPDRTAAIVQAVELARPGDVVLVCGKGHERSMCFGTVEHPWRDQEVLAWALERRLGLTDAPPPYRLPTAANGKP